MKKFILLSQLILSSTILFAQQNPATGQYHYINSVSSLDTEFNVLPPEEFILQVTNDKIALIVLDSFSNLLASRIVKNQSETWLIKDSVQVFCKLDSLSQALLLSIGDCPASNISVTDTTINDVLLTLKCNLFNCSEFAYTDRFAFDESDFIGSYTPDWSIALPMLPTGEAYLPTYFVRQLQNEEKLTIVYNLLSKSTNIDQSLFDIPNEYKEVSFMDFLSLMN